MNNRANARQLHDRPTAGLGKAYHDGGGATGITIIRGEENALFQLDSGV